MSSLVYPVPVLATLSPLTLRGQAVISRFEHTISADPTRCFSRPSVTISSRTTPAAAKLGISRLHHLLGNTGCHVSNPAPGVDARESDRSARKWERSGGLCHGNEQEEGSARFRSPAEGASRAPVRPPLPGNHSDYRIQDLWHFSPRRSVRSQLDVIQPLLGGQ